MASAFPTTSSQFRTLYTSSRMQHWLRVFSRFNDETSATAIHSLTDLIDLRERRFGRLVFIAHSVTDSDGGRRIKFPDGNTYSESRVLDAVGAIEIGTCRPNRQCDMVTPKEVQAALGSDGPLSDTIYAQRLRKKRLEELLAAGASAPVGCKLVTGEWDCGLLGEDDDE